MFTLNKALLNVNKTSMTNNLFHYTNFAKSFSYKVVFVRHGQSTWNLENRFTGWTDVDLTKQGVEEGLDAGKRLKENGFHFDLCYASVLKRAIKTWNNVAEVLDLHHIPVYKHWRLNERHYGALQGLNKSETAKKHGEEQVLIWRRAYDIAPPELDLTDERHPMNDSRYAKLANDILPRTECLKDTVVRVLPFWYDHIAESIKGGKSVVVCAHGNSLRAIVKHLDNLDDKRLPLVYELDNNLRPLKNYYLATDDEIKSKMHAVASQGKSK